MRVLALEPYYTGSHRYFLDEWSRRSAHDWDLITLPGHHWKWRMRHAAITFARKVATRVEQGQRWDRVVCTDMLNLAEFRGLAPAVVGRLPAVCYFHENQMTYPVRFPVERDHHFGMSNFAAAVAADAVWFNSQYHLEVFHQALEAWLRKMPEDRCLSDFENMVQRSCVASPGIEVGPPRDPREEGPIRIVWASRWEYDKAPEIFFKAMTAVKARGVAFRLSVLGESFRDVPPVFASAEERFDTEIDHWGYAQDRNDYLHTLRQADLFVSTAKHEFFGLSACEAMAQGAVPLLPQRLAYPELLELQHRPHHAVYFYAGDAATLAERIVQLAEQVQDATAWHALGEQARACTTRYAWSARVEAMDAALADVVVREA
ncbi:MAG: DUF3524 domain-containing protein [Planctomycetota bacterium]